MRTLKLYTSQKWLPPDKKWVILLYPFWGEVPLAPNDPDTGRFEEYLAKGKQSIELINQLENCDVAVLPFEYATDQESINYANKAATEALAANKKLLVFYNSDFTSAINLPSSIILRTSFFKSSKKNNEYAFPGWSVDFIKKYAKGAFSHLPKAPRPEISYCGYIDSLTQTRLSIFSKIKNTFKGKEKDIYKIGQVLRGKSVRALAADERIKTDFIIRNGFWAEGMEDKNKAKKEYAENMLRCPYALVVRGAGNFSYRLYEVLSCGRIPVFINTDCVLPYEELIDWKKHVVLVEEKEVGKLNDKIVAFHQRISEKDFINLQFQNRKLYEEWISPLGFFNHLYQLPIKN